LQLDHQEKDDDDDDCESKKVEEEKEKNMCKSIHVAGKVKL